MTVLKSRDLPLKLFAKSISSMSILMLLCTTSFANQPSDITAGEMALIPAYCPDTQGFKYGDAYSNTSPRASYWVGLMGKSFWHTHHYCWALLNLRRSEAAGRTPQERRGLREGAVGDLNYVINNSAPNFVLLPEIFTKLGEVHLVLGNIGAAYEAFLHARELNPGYWPAYSRWVSVLIQTGQKVEAKLLVKAGLAHAPESTVLQQQYRLLGGDPADIAPGPNSNAPQVKADHF